MNLADGFPINLPVLLESRLLVQANSGGGKSWALRRILEQTAPKVQQLVIDPEGEFQTLRERFDYVIAAPAGADAIASPKTAALLARRLLESGVSAILDIYDLKAHDRIAFVRLFCEALVNAPKSLWHPVLVVLDEAHVFAPQVGSAESLQAVSDIATRGRKRGMCLLAATQRLSKLHKDVAAELGNKMIGRTGLDVDVKRAADELGLTSKEATEQLRNLSPGEFFVYGPALSRTVERVRVASVQTSHPKSGDRMMTAPPAPSPKLRAQLAKLEGLQKDAEEEARTVDELKVKNAQLSRDIAAANRRAEKAGVPESEVLKRIAAAIAERAVKHPVAPASNLHKTDAKTLAKISALAAQIAQLTNSASNAVSVDTGSVSQPVRTAAVRQPVATSVPSAGLTAPQQRILDCLAWWEAIGVATPNRVQVAAVADYSPSSGGFANLLGTLRTASLIDYPAQGDVALTEAGRAAANIQTTKPTLDDLHTRVMGALTAPQQRLLRILLDAYPSSVSRHDIAAAADYSPSSGGFANLLGSLRSLGFIDYPSKGACVARSLLFPK